MSRRHMTRQPRGTRPWISAILATSLDGKITTAEGGPPRFPSRADKRHLMEQRARADAVIVGGGSIRNENPRIVVGRRFELDRCRRGQTPQPMVAIVSASGDLGTNPRFLATAGELRLYTTTRGARYAQSRYQNVPLKIRAVQESRPGELDLTDIIGELDSSGMRRIQCEGGGELVQRLLRLNLLDELALTLCPVIVGGRNTPSAAGFTGFALADIPRFRLVSSRRIGDELYLTYRRHR